MALFFADSKKHFSSVEMASWLLTASALLANVVGVVALHRCDEEVKDGSRTLPLRTKNSGVAGHEFQPQVQIMRIIEKSKFMAFRLPLKELNQVHGPSVAQRLVAQPCQHHLQLSNNDPGSFGEEGITEPGHGLLSLTAGCNVQCLCPPLKLFSVVRMPVGDSG